MEPLTNIRQSSNLDHRVSDSSLQRTLILIQPVENDDGVGDVDGAGDLGTEVVLDRVGEGGEDNSSTEFGSGNGVVVDNFTLGSDELTTEQTGGKGDSGMNGGNGDGFGGIGGNNELYIPGGSIGRDDSSAESYLLKRLNIVQVG